MKYLFLTIVFINLCSVLSAQEQQLKTITGPQTEQFLPLFEAIMDEAGLDFTFESLPRERAHHEFLNKNYDMFAFSFSNMLLLLPDAVKVPEYIIKEPVVAYVVRGNEIPIRGWSSIKSYDVGIIRGQKITEINTKNFPYLEIVLTPVSLFKMLEAGRIDVAVLMPTIAAPVLKQMGLLDKIIGLAPPIMYDTVHLFVQKEKKYLIPSLNAAIKKLRENGRIQELIIESIKNKNESSPLP